MRYLLDTHAIIWHFESSSKLPQNITKIIYNPKNIIYISSISLWEIAIKMKLNKLDLSITLDDMLMRIKNSDINVLQIEDEYLQILSKLPFLHKDPFDRLLISTALVEDLKFITVDENIQKYDVVWIW